MQRSFETREGEKRTVMEMEVDEVGPSLRYATAKVNKATRQRWVAAVASAARGPAAAPADDPWGSAPAGRRVRRTATVPAASTTSPRSRRRPLTPATTSGANHRSIASWLSHRYASRRRRSASSARTRRPHIDYKDTGLLRKYISDRGKIRARRVTGNCSQHQRDVAIAVKNAREVALLPYTSTAR